MQKCVTNTRPLVAADLDRVVAIDRALLGSVRRDYFQRRLLAALSRPKQHLQLGVVADDGTLLGFLLCRRAGGEFGRLEKAVMLETIGVDPTAQHLGLGQRLLADVVTLCRTRGIQQIVLQVDWRNESLIRFASRTGFVMSARWVLERSVARTSLPESEALVPQETPFVRALSRADFSAVCHIDRAQTGLDRTDYYERKFEEVLSESAIAVSLVAECEKTPAAFAMARVDFGSFGRVEPTAFLDTIGVQKNLAGHGYGQALLVQLLDNLSALHVERIETEVHFDHLNLLRFLYRFGFCPAQRLSLQKNL